jgi:hypothetical protein
VYRYSSEQPEFHLAVPQGQYSLDHFHIMKAGANRTRWATVTPWLLNVLTLPLGVVFIPTGRVDLSVVPHFSVFEINQDEVSYIGTLTIEIPDPLPMGQYQAHFKIADDGDEFLGDIQSHSYGAGRFMRRVIASMSAPGQPPD